MRRSVAGALLAAAAALACAQPGTPPGGPIDDSPPRVIETRPQPFDTLTDLGQEVIIRFDERISERLEGVTELREAVLVSPAKGVPIVDQDRRGIKVRLAGGWEPDRVYSVVILPVFRDLFGNQRELPVELVFSTGAPITESALAGFVEDRITGSMVPEARVAAVRVEDGESYVAVTDTGGFFAMRFIPPGRYDIQGWLDQDRDGEVDFFEAQDTTDTAFAAGDTTVVELALLPMDTTAAQLARAEPVDSTRVRLVFDDHFAADSVPGTARVYSLPDTTLVTDAGRLVHGARLDSILDAEEAVRDSLQAIQDSLAALRDTATADTVAAPAPARADTAGRPARRSAVPGRTRRESPGGRAQQSRPGVDASEERLPSRELILVLPEPLEPDTTYWVEVEGVVNIRGVGGGGGVAAFRTAALPDTVAADTMAADTTASEAAGAETAATDTAVIDTPEARPPDTSGVDSLPPLRGTARHE